MTKRRKRGTREEAREGRKRRGRQVLGYREYNGIRHRIIRRVRNRLREEKTIGITVIKRRERGIREEARKGEKRRERQVVGYREYNGIRYRIMPNLKTLILSSLRVRLLNIV